MKQLLYCHYCDLDLYQIMIEKKNNQISAYCPTCHKYIKNLNKEERIFYESDIIKEKSKITIEDLNDSLNNIAHLLDLILQLLKNKN